MNPLYVTLGAVFGWLLHEAQATRYPVIAGMFRGTNFHLAGVMGTAIAVCAIGFRLVRRWYPQAVPGPKPVKPRQFAAGLLFGLGWGITGACPGTALAQVGEGQLAALFTVAGILFGTWLYALQSEPKRESAG